MAAIGPVPMKKKRAAVLKEVEVQLHADDDHPSREIRSNQSINGNCPFCTQLAANKV